MYLDFENGALSLVSRLRDLGVSDERIEKQFMIVTPDDPFDDAALAALMALVRQESPRLIVFDAVAEAMALANLNPDQNDDVIKWSLWLPTPLAKTGAAVLLLDHVTKRREGRNGFAIGAQSKKGRIDGASYNVEVTEHFGRGRIGVANVSVAKDREGFVRQNAVGPNLVIAKLVVDALTDVVSARLELPCFVDLALASRRAANEQAPILKLAARLSAALERRGNFRSKEQLFSEVRARRSDQVAALNFLVENGYAAVVSRGGRHETQHVRRFTNGGEGYEPTE